MGCLDARCVLKKQTQKGCCGAASAKQRSLPAILVHGPTTARRAQFGLLCFQPEPVPESLTARMSTLTCQDPCRLRAWLGQTIYMVDRTYLTPQHASNQTVDRRCPVAGGRARVKSVLSVLSTKPKAPPLQTTRLAEAHHPHGLWEAFDLPPRRAAPGGIEPGNAQKRPA